MPASHSAHTGEHESFTAVYGDMGKDIYEVMVVIVAELRSINKNVCDIKEEAKGVREEMRGVRDEAKGVREEVHVTNDKMDVMNDNIRGITGETRGPND